jgi:branched-chain amino acid transport system permease protein
VSALGWYVYSEFAGVFILLLWALYLPFRGGQLYNGPIYCMAIGAYAAAFAARNLNWPFAWALLFAVAIASIVGFLTSFAFSRTTGIVTAIASIALLFILQSILMNLNFVGGAVGIANIPRIGYLPIVIWVFVFLIGLFVYRIDYSRLGRALEALRTDPDMARTLGMNLPSLSVFVMSVSSVIGALAGVFFAFTIGSINPNMFGFPLLLNTMAMLFIGGRYTMWGLIITAPFFWGLPLWVPPSISPYMNLVIGALLVIVLMVRPEGIVSREMIQNLKLWGKSWFRRDKGPLLAKYRKKEANR